MFDDLFKRLWSRLGRLSLFYGSLALASMEELRGNSQRARLYLIRVPTKLTELLEAAGQGILADAIVLADDLRGFKFDETLGLFILLCQLA